MDKKTPQSQPQPPLRPATVIALESIGAHKIALLSSGHVQIVTDPTTRVHLTPDEATKLYDFLLQYMSFLERRKQQNQGGN